MSTDRPAAPVLVLTPERLAALEALRWMIDAVAGVPRRRVRTFGRGGPGGQGAG